MLIKMRNAYEFIEKNFDVFNDVLEVKDPPLGSDNSLYNY